MQDVAMERYGSMGDFNEALEERRVLDERERRRDSRRGNTAGNSTPSSAGMRTPDLAGGRRFMFNSDDGSRPGSRAGFRRPGGPGDDDINTPGTGAGTSRISELRRSESGRSEQSTPRIGNVALPGPSNSSKISTPIPSVFTPTSLTRNEASGYPFSTPAAGSGSTTSKPPMSTEALNKLQAKVLRAKLMDDPNAQELEDEYEMERLRSENGGGDQGGAGMWAGSGEGLQGQMGRETESGTRTQVQVLPTLDGRGQLYDVGTGKEDAEPSRGNRRKKVEKVS